MRIQGEAEHSVACDAFRAVRGAEGLPSPGVFCSAGSCLQCKVFFGLPPNLSCDQKNAKTAFCEWSLFVEFEERLSLTSGSVQSLPEIMPVGWQVMSRL